MRAAQFINQEIGLFARRSDNAREAARDLTRQRVAAPVHGAARRKIAAAAPTSAAFASRLATRIIAVRLIGFGA